MSEEITITIEREIRPKDVFELLVEFLNKSLKEQYKLRIKQLKKPYFIEFISGNWKDILKDILPITMRLHLSFHDGKIAVKFISDMRKSLLVTFLLGAIIMCVPLPISAFSFFVGAVLSMGFIAGEVHEMRNRAKLLKNSIVSFLQGIGKRMRNPA